MNAEHLTQDDLVLYRYQESPDAAAVERHLDACRQCRDEYAALERVLGLVETGLGTSRVPEPAASYERQVWLMSPTTRAPSISGITPRPSASTTPTHSRPGTSGSGTG